MAWCKTNVSDFFEWIFFFLKVPECLHVLFTLVVKHSPVFFWVVLHFVSEKNKDKTSKRARMNAVNKKNLLLR